MYGVRCSASQCGARSGENSLNPLSGKDLRCYVARLARPRPAVRTSPVSFGSTRPASGARRSRTISTTVDAPVDNEEWGAVTADDIWDQGSAALRNQLAPATWAAWFHGVRPLTYDGEVLLLSVPSSLAAERIRSSYSGMLTDAIRDSTGVTVRVDLLVETDAREHESIALAPPPVTVVVDDHVTEAHRRSDRPGDDEQAGRQHLGVGHAERALHLRPVRHRRLEPLRPRRSAVRRRKPGTLLQPPVHLRSGRSGQDPPAPRHRAPRADRLPQQAGPVRVHRVVHERVRRRHPGQGDARASSAATATSTSSSSTTSSSWNARRSSRRSSSTRSTSSTARADRSSSRRTGRRSRSPASKTASAPASSGASSPTSSPPSSRPASPSSARRPNPSISVESLPRCWRSSPPTSATTSASSRAR